jgi:hypothetical protein
MSVTFNLAKEKTRHSVNFEFQMNYDFFLRMEICRATFESQLIKNILLILNPNLNAFYFEAMCMEHMTSKMPLL